ncbi:protein of unknown function [Georgfuchsia toluolica]|uniref:Uncharacterized protein n=1 Tax=Georgfuchsia toluolica TaxID=424218 RepID=A0A916J6D6_9PROT|nr:protein of unknown function [Georgfuchsia toluolica]
MIWIIWFKSERLRAWETCQQGQSIEITKVAWKAQVRFAIVSSSCATAACIRTVRAPLSPANWSVSSGKSAEA